MNMNSDDLMHLVTDSIYLPGEAPVLPELYLAIKDFNPDDTEPTLTKEHVNIMSFKIGEIIILTAPPNKAGWFEGYRSTDPDRICGIAHKNAVKKIHFK
jgi:hypothetical protein